MWTSHAGGGGHGLPRAARQGTRQVDVKSATRGVLTGRPGSGACARMACGAAAAAVLCAKVLVVCVCGASAVSPSCGCCSVARKLVRSDLCRVWSPHLLEHINYSSLLRVSYRWVRAFRRRCLQRRRWRRRRPRSWKLSCQCRPRAHALAGQTPQPSRPASMGAFALATGHLSADQLATSLPRIFTADTDMTVDQPPFP